MAIPALPPIGAAGTVAATAASQPAPAAGFGDALKRGVQQVSDLEHQAGAVTESLATGGPATIADQMVANTKASLGVDMLVAVRNRAVDAYTEIMRMPL